LVRSVIGNGVAAVAAKGRQKRMKSIGNVNLPPEAFIEVLKA
jgi:translation elongation factor EF-4